MAARKRIVVIGAGGCAREVAWTLRECAAARGELEFAGFAISDRTRRGPHDMLSEPLFDFDELANANVDGFVLGIGAPALRVKMLAQVKERFPNAIWPAIVHPTVQCDFASATIGEGTVICASAVVTVNVQLAPHVLVHYGALLSHEVSVGSNCNINPGCNLAGGVVIEEEVAIGIGAQVIQYLRVGARAVIGAGAVVVRDVPPGVTVAGVPARPLRKT